MPSNSIKFWGLEFHVPDYVLPPYRETEALVRKILTILCTHTNYKIADLGTGSGCIAIALAKHRPDGTITATDIDPDVVKIAQSNADRHGVDIEFKTGSWCEPLKGTYDMIIANVPFLPDDDPSLVHLTHLPELALISGQDGLDATREVCRDSYGILNDHGWLFIGNSSFKSNEALEIMAGAGFRAKSLADTNGEARFTMGQKA